MIFTPRDPRGDTLTSHPTGAPVSPLGRGCRSGRGSASSAASWRLAQVRDHRRPTVRIQTHSEDCGIRGAPLCGRVEIADHVIFASQSGSAWSVVINGMVVDRCINRDGALDLVSRLASALRAGSPAAASPQRDIARSPETDRWGTIQGRKQPWDSPRKRAPVGSL